MKRFRESEVVLLGSGPVGLVAAIELSKRYRTTVITRQLPCADAPPRVEAVPASLLAALVDIGIHPRRIGVEDLHESRLIAWEQEAFEESHGPVSAHVERPALDLAVLDAVVASRRVRIQLSDHPDCFRAAMEAARRKEIRLIDATGRRSASATKRVQPPKPWAARTFLASRQSCNAHTDLRIAALPGGFAYRLGGAQYLVLGIVGRKETIMGDPLRLEQQLYEVGAGRILKGLPSIGDMTPGIIAPASVQWTNEDVGVRIGDAALARDTLSSQGLAAGISEAFYAAAIRSDGDESLFYVRQVEQRLVHIRSLASLVVRCRFRENEPRQEYSGFLAEHANYQPSESSAALRAGQITAC